MRRPRTAPTTWNTRSTTRCRSASRSGRRRTDSSRENKDFGFFAQDQWTLQRLTVTYGLRYEYFNGYVPPQSVPATPNGWVPARSFARSEERAAVEGPRSARRRRLRPLRQRTDGAEGGDRPLRVEGGDHASPQNNNPIQTSINSVTRTWNDSFYPVGDPRRGNYIPDCDLSNRALNGECGAMANQNFGGNFPTTRYADDALLGYGARGYNWDFTTEVQHQLRPGVSMSRRLLPQLVRQLPRHGQHAGDARRTSIRSASRRRRTRGCRAAAATRCAVCTTSTPAKFGQVNSVDHAVGQLREDAARQRLLQRHHQRAARLGPPGRRRRGHSGAA